MASAENCHPGHCLQFPRSIIRTASRWRQTQNCCKVHNSVTAFKYRWKRMLPLEAGGQEAIPDSSFTCAWSTGGHFILNLSPPCAKMGLKYWQSLTHTAQVRPKHSYKEGKFSIMDIRAALEIHTRYRLTWNTTRSVTDGRGQTFSGETTAQLLSHCMIWLVKQEIIRVY